MQALRRVLFYIFVIIYAVICPLLIAYSLGYIVNPVKKAIERGGLVYLSSTPAGANVYLGRSRYVYKTPATISGLLPGKYKITVRLKKYRKWAHTARVEAGKAVAFGNILLIPERWQPAQLGRQRYTRLIPLAGSDTFIVEKGSDPAEYFVYNCKRSKLYRMPKFSPAIKDIGLAGAKSADVVQIKFCRGRDTRQCFWLSEGSHLIFLENDDLFLLEIEPDLTYHREKITSVLGGTRVFYSRDTGELYYLERRAGRLQKIRIMPK